MAKRKVFGVRSKKRKQYFNPKQSENVEKSFTSSSAEKLKIHDEINVPQSAVQYKIINFTLVFTAIFNSVTCSRIIDNKICNGKVNFSACQKQGLGFKIEVDCEKCDSTYIDSGKKVGQSYEINRRFIFVMRLLGLGLAGCNKFYGLMDLSCSFLTQTVYDSYINQILECVCTVTDKLLSFAVNAEKNEMCAETGIDSSDLTISSDGTWTKHGFTSLFSVTSVIGYYSGKVLDVFCKSSDCNQCEFWKKECTTAEFEEWHNQHIESNKCTAIHEGPSGNMEMQAIHKLFERSHDKYGVKYNNYIGDGDSKVYKKVLEAKPYGQDYQINKKECIGHVQKRMGTRLRELVKNTVEDKEIKEKTIKKNSFR